MNKKIFSLFLGLTVLVSFVSFTSQVRGDVNSAVAYLKTKPANPWITMALVAASETPDVEYLKTTTGTKATDYEAPILALTAAGKNPRTFANENLVAKLKSYYSNDQIGDLNLLNDDIFGILALISAGESVSDEVIQGAKNFILNHQNQNGSWSFALGTNGDTNMTAMAIMALSEVGLSKADSAISKALEYLKSAQNIDGGFPYDPQSQWNTDSDVSSDAWVISALNKIGENPATWQKQGQSPLDHLNTLETSDGYYRFQAGTSEDSFSPVTTSYAVIALTGKFFPVAKFTTPAFPEVTYRIEGKNETVCAGKAEAPTALELIKIISEPCGFNYVIKQTTFGPYLESIGNDVPEGFIGWLYVVNFVSPQVGAVDYALNAGDDVLWYYGDFNWKLTRLTLSQNEIQSGANVTAKVEYFDASTWRPLEGAVLHFGLNTQTVNSSGEATLTPQNGAYQIYATKDGYLKTEKEKLIVGGKTGTTLNLSVNILGGSGGGGGNPGGETVGFSINLTGGGSNLVFGDLSAGLAKSQNINLVNNGDKNLYLETNVTGDEVFRNYLDLDSKDWEDWNAEIESKKNKNTKVEIKVPSSYSSGGEKAGQLIFWAIPLND